MIPWKKYESILICSVISCFLYASSCCLCRPKSQFESRAANPTTMFDWVNNKNNSRYNAVNDITNNVNFVGCQKEFVSWFLGPPEPDIVFQKIGSIADYNMVYCLGDNPSSMLSNFGLTFLAFKIESNLVVRVNVIHHNL